MRIDAFVPVLAALLFVNNSITAALLFGQFSIVRSHALLVIASAYVFTGVMAILFRTNDSRSVLADRSSWRRACRAPHGFITFGITAFRLP